MTTFTSKHSTPQRKEPPSQQINSLYHQFESLKSQIYNSKSNRKNTNFPRKWDNQQNYYDAQSVLRESTIRKYSKEFKEQLQQIKESRKQHHQKQPVEVNNQLFTELDSSPQQRDKRRKKEEKWMNMFSLFKQKINVEEQRQHEGVDVLSTVLLNYKNSKENIQRSGIDQELASEIIGNALKQYQNYQNGLLYIMADRLNFFSKKMNCLQRIISECSKIIKLSNQNKRSKQLSEHILLINLKTLETKYETEIKRLVKHYEDKITQLNKQNKNKNSSQKDSEGWKGQEEENSQLKLILQQTKKLLVTKEEIITSLQQQNGQLKRQILKINQQKQEFSLGYSMTGRKLKVSTQKMNSSEPEKLKEEDMHEHEEDINFNELESVKEKSFEEWDISHLEMRHNTNTKSMAGDFKEIYENEVDQYS